jgi:hypothetical protein
VTDWYPNEKPHSENNREVLVMMKQFGRFGWYRLSESITETNLIDDGINKCSLSEFVAPILVFLDRYVDIVGRMTLILISSPDSVISLIAQVIESSLPLINIPSST